MIHIYQIINGAGLICSLILGFYTLFIGPRNKLNFLFFLKCSMLSLFILVATLTEFAENENVILLYKITMGLGAFLVVFFFQFYIELTAVRIPVWMRSLFYLLAIAVVITIFQANPVLYSYTRHGYFWKFTPAYNEPWFYCWILYLFSYFLISIVLLFKWGSKTKLNKEKKQSRILVYSITMTLSIIVITDIVLPVFDVFKMPYLSTISLTIYVSALYYTLIEYRFLKFDISNITGEIISNINEIVLVVDPELTIITSNNSFQELLSDTQENTRGRPLFDVIFADSDIKQQLSLLIDGKESRLKCRIYYKKGPEAVMTDSYISRLADQFSDPMGILIISRENKGEKQLRIAYKLTDREFEIINLCIAGLSNREIGDRLGITERTVESHINNTYNKLGINKRIELINLAHEFNLIQKNHLNMQEG